MLLQMCSTKRIQAMPTVLFRNINNMWPYLFGMLLWQIANQLIAECLIIQQQCPQQDKHPASVVTKLFRLSRC